MLSDLFNYNPQEPIKPTFEGICTRCQLKQYGIENWFQSLFINDSITILSKIFLPNLYIIIYISNLEAIASTGPVDCYETIYPYDSSSMTP